MASAGAAVVGVNSASPAVDMVFGAVQAVDAIALGGDCVELALLLDAIVEVSTTRFTSGVIVVEGMLVALLTEFVKVF